MWVSQTISGGLRSGRELQGEGTVKLDDVTKERFPPLGGSPLWWSSGQAKQSSLGTERAGGGDTVRQVPATPQCRPGTVFPNLMLSLLHLSFC